MPETPINERTQKPCVTRVMAFDYGTKKIGVAVGQSVTGAGQALTNLPARDGVPDWDEIETLLADWRPDDVLVGLPLNMDGTESELSLRARKFGRRLHGRFGVNVTMVDERLSSREARERIEQSRFNENHAIDSHSAAILIDSWFQ